MSQISKNTFLEKFDGKTSKISKNGLGSILASPKNHEDKDAHLKNIDLDVLIPSNPERKSDEISRKRTFTYSKPPLKPQKQDYVPTSVSFQEKEESLSQHPPSRSSSNTTNSRGKYIFGKYLKLDKSALGHIDYLQGIEQKSLFKRSSNSGIPHRH